MCQTSHSPTHLKTNKEQDSKRPNHTLQIAKMVRQRKEKKAKDIKLRQPDRSAPSEKTLLEIAQDRNLFDMADKQERKNKKSKDEDSEEEKDEDEGEDLISPGAERIMEIALYAVCLAMLHYTLDYLVQHQYAMEMDHKLIISRAVQALFGSSYSPCSTGLDAARLTCVPLP